MLKVDGIYPIIETHYNSYPKNPSVYPNTGDVYLNEKKLQIYRYNGEQFYETDWLPYDLDHYMRETNFYNIRENIYYFFAFENNEQQIIDIILYYKYNISDVTKYIGRKNNRNKVIIYQFNNQEELAIFHLFFANQITYPKK